MAGTQLGDQVTGDERVLDEAAVDQHGRAALHGDPLIGGQQRAPQVQDLLALGEEPVSARVHPPLAAAPGAGQTAHLPDDSKILGFTPRSTSLRAAVSPRGPRR